MIPHYQIEMNVALKAFLLLICFLQIYTAQSRRVRKCYGYLVCGVNGKTYRSECSAWRSGISVACRGQCPCKSNCICTREYDPVCGTNGQTYSNKCVANCAGISVACRGQCPCNSNCICTLEYDPVCGTNGQTYGNKCAANCALSRVQCEGICHCGKPCICPDIYKPMCAVIQCKGRCPCQNCLCPYNYNPVCGIDGQTYPNSCSARCNGVPVLCPWACPCFVIG